MALHETNPDAAWDLASSDPTVFKQYVMATYELTSEDFDEVQAELQKSA